MGEIAFLTAFLAGLASFFSPCVFPLLPLYFSVLVPRQGEEFSRLKILTSALSFTLGFTLVFILVGLTASTLGNFLLQHQIIIRQVGGICMVLLGLLQMGLLQFNFLQRDWRPFLKQNFSAQGKGAFFLGMVFVFGWMPCTGPVLAGILIYAGIQQSLSYGAYLLFSYSLGFGLPLLILALLTENLAKSCKNKITPHLESIQKLAGLVLVILGIFLYFDYVTRLINFLS